MHRVLSLTFLLHLFQLKTGEITGSSDIPLGHGDILGKHRPSDGHIDVWTKFPSPQLFWDQYASKRKPALFRGAALSFPAMKKWTDEFMREKFGSLEVKLEHKYEKKDYPIGTRGVGRDTIKSFIDTYKNTSAYIVSQLPDPMSKDVLVLPFVTCGSFYERLLEANLWLSSGGSKSLLHRDADNAFNCLLNGTKDWILIDPKYEDKIPIAEGDRGYGGFATLDVDRVNLLKYHKFRDVPWQYANVTAGDCLFLPYGYWHQVRSYGSKNLAVSVLFSRLKTFDNSGCNASLDYMSLNDTNMVWTYPGYGRQTLGNPDPFEVRDGFMDEVSDGKRLTAKELQRRHPVFEEEVEGHNPEEFKDEIEELGKKLLTIMDVDKNGYVDIKDIKALTVEQLKAVGDATDFDPANSDQYEHYSIQPEDLRRTIRDAINPMTRTLSEEDFVKLYVAQLHGSERWAREVFQRLKGDSKEVNVPADVIMNSMEDVLKDYKRKGVDDRSGEFYAKEELDDRKIMEQTIKNAINKGADSKVKREGGQDEADEESRGTDDNEDDEKDKRDPDGEDDEENEGSRDGEDDEEGKKNGDEDNEIAEGFAGKGDQGDESIPEDDVGGNNVDENTSDKGTIRFAENDQNPEASGDNTRDEL